jgi:ribosomal protein S18 acetylase RimI-like enzyme
VVVVHHLRERRACEGELVQIDGSPHNWFEERAEPCVLLVFIDDATGKLLHLLFVESESFFSYCRVAEGYFRQHGKPVAFYSDMLRKRHFVEMSPPRGAGTFLLWANKKRFFKTNVYNAGMASITLPARVETHHPHMRPMNILRDLPAVADLVELCFSHTMDHEGRSYVKQMRDAGHDNSFLRWADQMVESASLPLSGFVWEESGKIVGNASLVPYRYHGKKIYLVANVATHPDHRRRGIGRALTEQALQLARRKKAHAIWLHVRDDNPGAVKMYADLGFIERARRTTWKAETDPLLPTPETGLVIGKRHPRFWPQQLNWLRETHPDELAWSRNWSWTSLQPGLQGWFYRFFVEYDVRQWAALKNGELLGTLAWVPAGGRADPLWAAMKADGDESALESLLRTARRQQSYRRALTLEYPAGRAVSAIESAGFRRERTLIWMLARDAT